MDINLTDQQILELQERSPWVEYRRDLPVDGEYDLVLVLLLDLLEHVEQDRTLLSYLMDRFVRHMERH